MNPSKRPLLRNYIVFFLISQAVLLGYYFFCSNHKQTRYYNNIIGRLQVEYNAVLYAYRNQAQLFFHGTIEQPQVTKIVKAAMDGGRQARSTAILGQQLRANLTPALKLHHLNLFPILQFLTPEGQILLDLSDIQPDSLVAAPRPRPDSGSSHYAEGFVLADGSYTYRYLFSLTDDKEQLGMVALGLPFYMLKEGLVKSFPAEYFFLHEVAAAQEQGATAGSAQNLIPSDLDAGYFYTADELRLRAFDQHSGHLEADTIAKISDKLHGRLSQKLASRQPFAATAHVGELAYAATFLPVHDIHNEFIGYLFSYQQDPTINFIHREGRVIYILLSGLVIVLLLSHRIGTGKLHDRLRFQKTLIEAIPIPLFFKDKTGRFLGCNNAFSQFIGRPTDEILGRTINDLAPSRLATDDHEADQCLLGGGDTQTYESMVQTPDGRARQVIFNKALFTDHRGETQGLIGTISDITDRQQAEERLKNSHMELQQIFNTAADGMRVVSLEFDTIKANDTFAAMTGLTKEELIGKKCFDTFPGPLCHTPDCPVTRIANGKTRVIGELEKETVSGRRFPVLYTAAPFLNLGGQLMGVIENFKDISERQRSEQAVQRLMFGTSMATGTDFFNSLVEQLARWLGAKFVLVGEIMPDKLTKVRGLALWNNGHPDTPMDYDLTGTPCELVNENGFCLYPEHVAQLFPQDAALTEMGVEFYAGIPLRDENNHPMGILCALHETPLSDIPHLKEIFQIFSNRAAAEIKRLRSEKALAEAIQRAEEANRAKGMFLANMSHEIRTPMSAILGMNRLALDTNLSNEQRRYLKTVQDSASSLLGLLNDILDFSKIEAGQLELAEHPFDVRQTMESIVQTLAIKALENNVEIFCQLPPAMPTELIGDALRLRQVLYNIVGNAVKFTTAGQIIVRVAIASETAKSIETKFSVIDSGIGIPADRQAHIFDHFTQADNTVSRNFGGSGLGLAIAKKLTELMGGRIWLESAPGQGSTFHFTARFLKQPGATPDKSELPGIEAADCPVLVVDDQPVGRTILTDELRHLGFPVREAADAEQARQLLTEARRNNTPFGLMLLDFEMPATDGKEFLQQLNQAGERHKLPVILMCNLQHREIHSCCEQLECISLEKPIIRAELVNSLQLALCPRQMAASAACSTETAPQNRAAMHYHLLVVEDNPGNRELARMVLENGGHTVTVATHGIEALTALSQENFDAVLMDVQMPVLDGIAATRIIRQCERGEPVKVADHLQAVVNTLQLRLEGRRTPILAMTAHAMAGDREWCLEAGMDNYLTKPFNPDEVFAMLAASIEQPVAAPPATPQAPPAKAEPLSLESLRHHLKTSFRLKADKVDQLVATYRENMRTYLTDAERALANGDFASLGAAAHSISGILIVLDLKDLHSISSQIDGAIKQGNTTLPFNELLARLQGGLAPIL